MPFEVPENWEWVNIMEILLKLTDGTHHSPKNYPKGNYKYITAKNIKNEGIILDDVTYVDDETHHEIFSRCNPEYGDILYIKDGATTGVVAINKLTEDFSLLSSVALLKPSKLVSNKYLFYYLQSSYCYESVRSSMKGVGITRITLKQIADWDVPIPPIGEQHRIVEYIDSLFSQIDLIAKDTTILKSFLEKYKHGILDLAIAGKLVPQDPSEEPAVELLMRINPTYKSCDNRHYGNTKITIPRNWCWVKLGEIFDVVSAKRVFQSEWQKTGIPFYRAREIVKLSNCGHVDNELYISIEHFESLKNKYGAPEADDIMLSAVGTIGKCYIVNKKDRFYYKDASVLCLKNIHNLNSEYIKFVLDSSVVQMQMQDQSKGTTVDTITIEKAKGYYIPLPPVTEQSRIVKAITLINHTIDKIAAIL